MIKAIEDIQQLHHDPKHATTNSLNLHAGGSHHYDGKDPRDKKKQAVQAAVRQRLQRQFDQALEYPED